MISFWIHASDTFFSHVNFFLFMWLESKSDKSGSCGDPETSVRGYSSIAKKLMLQLFLLLGDIKILICSRPLLVALESTGNVLRPLVASVPLKWMTSVGFWDWRRFSCESAIDAVYTDCFKTECHMVRSELYYQYFHLGQLVCLLTQVVLELWLAEPVCVTLNALFVQL